VELIYQNIFQPTTGEQTQTVTTAAAHRRQPFFLPTAQLTLKTGPLTTTSTTLPLTTKLSCQCLPHPLRPFRHPPSHGKKKLPK